MFKVEIDAENRDEIIVNNILNLESLSIFQDLQKRCHGKAFHYTDFKDAPFVAYKLPENFVIAFKANKESTTFYINDIQSFGTLSKLGIFSGTQITTYANDKIHTAVKGQRLRSGLTGSSEKLSVIKVDGVSFAQYEKLMASASTASTASTASLKKEMPPEELLKKLERQDAISTKGEDFAIEYEKNRLEKLGANLSKIDEYIIDRRKINVSQGYDIESHFDGQSRYIEVKTTTVNAEADFFFSTNEFNVLKAKGEEAYIYRVLLSEDLESIVEIREIQNPFGDKETSAFKAIAFKASLKDFEKK